MRTLGEILHYSETNGEIWNLFKSFFQVWISLEMDPHLPLSNVWMFYPSDTFFPLSFYLSSILSCICLSMLLFIFSYSICLLFHIPFCIASSLAFLFFSSFSLFQTFFELLTFCIFLQLITGFLLLLSIFSQNYFHFLNDLVNIRNEIRPTFSPALKITHRLLLWSEIFVIHVIHRKI